MYVLNGLWNGDINLSQKFFRNGTEYAKLTESLTEISQELLSKLPEGSIRLVDSYTLTHAKLSDIAEEDAFIEGVRFGARFMLDVLGEYKGAFTYDYGDCDE